MKVWRRTEGPCLGLGPLLHVRQSTLGQLKQKRGGLNPRCLLGEEGGSTFYGSPLSFKEERKRI